MNVINAEVYNNLALCSFYAQQYSTALPYFEKALQAAQEDSLIADIWFNISHIAMNVGDLDMSRECLKLAIASNSNHAEAWNNLGVMYFYNHLINLIIFEY